MIESNEAYDKICGDNISNCDACPISKPCNDDNKQDPNAYVIKMNREANKVIEDEQV